VACLRGVGSAAARGGFREATSCSLMFAARHPCVDFTLSFHARIAACRGFDVGGRPEQLSADAVLRPVAGRM
jgi:hypothetical protein